MDSSGNIRILIINAHWNNRGDEAALRALIDAITDRYDKAEITVQLYSTQIEQFPAQERVRAVVSNYPRTRNKIEFPFYRISGGRFVVTKELKEFLELLMGVDLVIHAPGGPSIGDIYVNDEDRYIYKLMAAYVKKIPYCFYAPSMGPFLETRRNRRRRFVYNHAAFICCREDISAKYLEALNIEKPIHVTLDSAFQNEINERKYSKQLIEYNELYKYLRSHERVIGITITDLKWHPVYQQSSEIQKKIRTAFLSFISNLTSQNYGVVFIPQLFGECNDSILMSEYDNGKCFVVSDQYDAYFQQYLIGRLFAVVGMRYHSNIFSAKMKTPFISISYEQKMLGFMQKANLMDYCIRIEDLNVDKLNKSFDSLVNNYDSYKKELTEKSILWKIESKKTTDMLYNTLENIVND